MGTGGSIADKNHNLLTAAAKTLSQGKVFLYNGKKQTSKKGGMQMKNSNKVFWIFMLIFFFNVSFAESDGNSSMIPWLKGTWLITNETIDSTYSNHQGQVTFYGDQLSIDWGRFAAAGIVAHSESSSCLRYIDPISYKLLGKGYIYLRWEGRSQGVVYQQDAMMQIVRWRTKQITLIGVGGCGRLGTPRISYLTRVK